MKGNVDVSIKYLERLEEIYGEEWKQRLDNYLKDEETGMDEDGKECIAGFLMTYKEEIMDNATVNLQKVEKKINNDLLFKNLRSFIDDMLEPFYVSAPVRAFCIRKSDDMLGLLEEMFSRTILRIHADILQEYIKFGFENEDAFIGFLNALDTLCTYAIKKNLYRDAIEDLIYSQTRLPREICKKLAELIDSNFDVLRMKYIIEKLDSLEEKGVL